MKLSFTIIVVVLFPLFVQSQYLQIYKPGSSIDSLKKVLPLLQGRARVDCLNELAISYNGKWELNYWDSSMATVRNAYSEAFSINYAKGLGDACLTLGYLYADWYFRNSDKLVKYMQEAIFWYKKAVDDEGLGQAYLRLGHRIFYNVSIEQGRKMLERSVSHFNKTGNKVMLAELNDQFGEIDFIKGEYEKHFECIKQGLKEKIRIGDDKGMILSFYRLCRIHSSAGDFQTALDYLRLSYQKANTEFIPWKIFTDFGDMFLHLKKYDSSMYYYQNALQVLPTDAGALLGIGRLLVLQKKYNEAIDTLQKAIKIFHKWDHPLGVTWSMVELGKSYAGLKQYTKALQYSRKCIALAKHWKLNNEVQNAYEIHWNVYEVLQQSDSAYFYLRKFVTLKDSLNDAKYKRQYLQKLALYKTEIKEEQQQARIDLLHKDNQIKKQQLQKEALMKKILAGSLVSIVLLSIIILRNIVLKRRNEKHLRELAENELQIQKLESERTKAELQQQTIQLQMQALRAQMNPHFIFNSLNSINRFILKKQSREAAEYLTKFARLIRTILHSSANATVTLAEDLEALQLYMELESLRFEQKFIYKIQCDPDVDANFIQIPPMLLQPYVENAIWHGLMLKKGEGHLWVNISQDDSTLICTITDDGIGRKKSAEIKSKSAYTSKSMGMRITADRIAVLQQQKQLKAFIEVTDLVLSDGTAGGTEVLIKIPVAYD